MGFEQISFTIYKYPRHVTRPTIDGEAVTQRIGMEEVMQWRLEWVKADRITEIIRENFPQENDEDFIIQGDISITPVIGEGHDLFDVSLTATRFVGSEGSSDDLDDTVLDGDTPETRRRVII